MASSGGIDVGAQISGGEQDVYGAASGVTVFTGSQVVESGGTASGTVLSGGTAVVFGTETAVTILSGGTGEIFGSLSGGTIGSGGLGIIASPVESYPELRSRAAAREKSSAAGSRAVRPLFREPRWRLRTGMC